MVPLVLEDALSSELSSAEFSPVPQAAALLLRDAVRCAAQEGPVLSGYS